MQNGTGAKAQPFSEHVRELRQRLLISVAALLVGGSVGYMIHERLFSILRRPLHAQLYYTTPTGGFNAIIKISILFGVVVAIPVFIYQLGKFLSPAFNHRIRSLRIIVSSVILAILGVLFGYYISLPAALHFLANVDTTDLKSLITVNEYLNFVFAYLAGFALLFQLPLILLFINRIKPQRPGRLMRYQRWVILISFILAAFLTPTPDPINQTIMALPIIALYQFSVILIWFANRRNGVVWDKVVPVAVPLAPTPQLPAPAPAAPTPEPARPAPQPAAYGAAAYSTPAPFSSAAPQPAPKRPAPKPILIMDIFPVPQTPAT